MTTAKQKQNRVPLSKHTCSSFHSTTSINLSQRPEKAQPSHIPQTPILPPQAHTLKPSTSQLLSYPSSLFISSHILERFPDSSLHFSSIFFHTQCFSSFFVFFCNQFFYSLHASALRINAPLFSPLSFTNF